MVVCAGSNKGCWMLTGRSRGHIVPIQKTKQNIAAIIFGYRVSYFLGDRFSITEAYVAVAPRIEPGSRGHTTVCRIIVAGYGVFPSGSQLGLPPTFMIFVMFVIRVPK